MKKYEIQGKQKEELLNDFIIKNNLLLEQLIVIEEELTTTLFKRNKVKLYIIKKEELINNIISVLKEIVSLMNIKNEIKSKESKNILSIEIKTNNPSVLIGKNGTILRSFQNIINQFMYKKKIYNFKVNIDIEGYKQKENERLEKEILDIIKTVEKTRVSVSLDPMNSYHRRLVHSLSSEKGNLETKSHGEGMERFVEIKYKEKQE